MKVLMLFVPLNATQLIRQIKIILCERAKKLASAFVIKDHGFVTVSLDDNTSNLKQFIIVHRA